MLALCLLINYVDRGNISVAAPLLKQEFGLSPSQLGVLFAAFFASYTLMQFIVGWLVDSFDVNKILAAGFLVWSLATATTGVARGFAMLLLLRLILGIGESVALPASSKIIARQLTEHYRGFASGIVMAGLRTGNAIGTFGAGMLMANFGWRPVFIWIGLISLLWLPAWARWMPRDDYVETHSSTRTGGFSEVFAQRSFWGTCLGQFCCNYLFYFMVTWLPSYLVIDRHLSMATMARIAGVYYLADAASAISTGWLQDLLIRKGNTPTFVRKSAMAIGFSIAAFAIVGCALAGANAYLPWLMAAGAGCGMTSPGILAFTHTLAGPQMTGRWYGPQNGFANLAGVVSPAATGFILQRTGNFQVPIAITAAFCIVGGLAWVLLVGRLEQVQWATRPR